MTHPLKLLLVEDSALDTELALAVLRRNGFETTWTRVETELDFRQALRTDGWEMILSDHGIPSFNSLEALRVVHEMEVSTPLVVLSGTIGEEAAIEALQAGARDVVLKTNLARLGPVLKRELAEAQNRRHKLALEAKLRHDAFHDELTGLPNRRLALDRAQQMLYRARREDRAIGALYLDLDGFKQVNDEFGHAAGDQLLRLLAGRLTSVLRESDTAARLAGDEFVVLVEGAASENMPQIVAQRLLQVLNEPYHLDAAGGRLLTVPASIGVTTEARETGEEFLHDADVALYAAKRSGRNQYVLFESSMRADARHVISVRTDLAEALKRQEFFLLYQPIFDLRTELAIGVEALLRWRRPDGTISEPDAFIPIAEKSGLLVPIGRWVLDEACRQVAAWQMMGHATGVSVNLSARQLDRDDLIDDVRDVLARSGLTAPTLTVDVTETTFMRDAVAHRLDALKALGVRVAVDDFGTGDSSLAYLSQFPPDALNIDRSLITGTASPTMPPSLVPTIVQLARTLGMKTLAEGIEEPAQLRAAQRDDCDHGQGFLLARPMDPQGVETLLANGRRHDTVMLGANAAVGVGTTA